MFDKIKIGNFTLIQDFDIDDMHLSIYNKAWDKGIKLSKTQEADLEDLIKTFFNEVHVENKYKKDKET